MQNLGPVLSCVRLESVPDYAVQETLKFDRVNIAVAMKFVKQRLMNHAPDIRRHIGILKCPCCNNLIRHRVQLNKLIEISGKSFVTVHSHNLAQL